MSLDWEQVSVAMLEGIISGIIATPAAALLLEAIKRILDKQTKRKLAFLCDEWYSAYQNQEEDEEPWTKEKVNISSNVSYRGLKLYFKFNKRLDGNYWKGEGYLVDEEFIIGSWDDTINPLQKGKFQLRITPDGSVIGTVDGPTRKSLLKRGAWILAKKPEQLDQEIHRYLPDNQ